MSQQDKHSEEQLGELKIAYARVEHWISGDEFYADEFAFLINLTDKYFIGVVMADATISEKLKEVANRLFKLDETRISVARQNREYRTYLAECIQNKKLFDQEEYKERQTDLEGEQTIFLKDYRSVKKDIFRLSEQLLVSARNRKLIGS